MKSTKSDRYFGARLDRQVQIRRVRQVMERELSPRQRQVVEGVFYERLSQAELARRLGVNRSTVCRTLHRAAERMRRCLEY